MPSTLLFNILHTIYPLQNPNKTRDRPLEVLAVGLSRTGTDSLRQALLEVGYQNVYHGFSYGASPNDCIQWIRLGQAQERGDKSFLNAKEFDRILGDCDAVTDIPPAGFANELLDAFPDAKVILNYREDVDAWVTSCLNSIETTSGSGQPWYEYFLSYFGSSLFFRQWSYWYVWARYFGGDFRRNGKAWYLRHYRDLETKLEGRKYLKWKAEDGWEPLCKFLDKTVPLGPFPHGNAPEEFFKTVEVYKAEWTSRSEKNMRLIGGILASVIVGVVGFAYARS
ncbi:hypothetical protein M409DRAFT_64992 [Zasmidium cellare ATCC 36951]|uniref:NAD dependent epimerase/dehydratase n=1 Tax=Zasmidium cellare ATCC 36951 TaxID=1080233 RepID=A0A6A6CQ39_ZASCE|nr:uncharacterized protein M409DRAFT_64992 [Zasmidium cellare ATCC 36951]KAF2169264.1 hypothetical protein M409DRAFT_64992 [Zasmidium cellare ATCC 36951]